DAKTALNVVGFDSKNHSPEILSEIMRLEKTFRWRGGIAICAPMPAVISPLQPQKQKWIP
ncbi:MAG: hypothetical protein Q8M43_09505, partial [Sulfuricurvum sp.]|uniref:hypothetical protein n=1 Tax=Sulfuricurvum sp. TaxID=2025608 RepID=UPI00273316E4